MKIRFIRALPQIDHVVPAGTVLDAPQGFAHKMVRQKFAVFVDKETPGAGTERVSGQEKAVPSVNPIEEAMKKAHAAVSGTAKDANAEPEAQRHAEDAYETDQEDEADAEAAPAGDKPEAEEDADKSEDDDISEEDEADEDTLDDGSPDSESAAPDPKTERTDVHETVTDTKTEHESEPAPAKPAAAAQKKPVRKAKTSAK